jgi:hypothetical protein
MVGISDITGAIKKEVEDAASSVGLASKPVTRKALSSSWLSMGEYDPNDQTLDLTTLKGGTFTHYGVPEDVATAFFAAPSPGQFWHTVLKDQY